MSEPAGPSATEPPAARALWLAAPGRVELRTAPLPPVGEGDVVVRTLWTGISRGTEALVFRGGVPESEHERMRAPFQEGRFPAPVKYGYCAVGRVEAGPPSLVGRTVFALHPHQDRFVVPAAAAVPLPDALLPGRAVLAANMETALNIVWDAGIGPGDRVAIVGGGVVGLLVARLAGRMPAADVTLVDIDPARALPAAALGCRFALPDEAPRECDVVVHASGRGEGLVTALGLAGFEATIVEASWYGDRSVELPLGGAFHARRLRLVSSQVGQVAPARRARFDYRRRLETALALLADPALDVLISGETPFAALDRHYAAILADPATLMHRIRYD
ncbi:zinc-dependent alcohol dehydrogenase [Prosthecomicrobium pneumaticum]|uniref:2-desacetyl-2-hydroxyethyl bacteriochlorophyllide A dehydrogenase n=1 Tax=Prosthecomicrobium pneumaticum TaxID=81895 RepID=A0A7W9FPL0_9HYPH|nr:zinc-binding alcohol dehydrogenase [Prosthecomicrobium pneumaticum]MBB5754441.1 2-desacetyl-2-hydroxyethyl bacteriochlorophyllide A dehydrogenase [Prosthecomicrobium pneumaticum]